MQPTPKPRASFLRGIASGALVAVVVVAVAMQLSAPVTAVVIDGNSMQPSMRSGDLMLTRPAARYETGDVVAYRQPGQGLVMHRIVAWEDGRLVLQGDNNPYRDSYRPLPSEVVGRQLVRIPGGGKLARWLRGYQSMFGVAVAGASIALMATRWRRRARGRDQPEDPRRVAPRRMPVPSGAAGSKMASSFTLVATFSGIVLIASLLAGTRRDVPVDNDYSHVGTFSYRAYGGEDVYDTPFAETGDPVFRSLADSVDLRFDYRLDTSLVAAVSGTYSLVARLSHPNGWTRTLELAPPGAFDKAPFSVEGVFDLSRAQELIDRMEEQAVMNNEAYVVTFVADVEVAGTVGGHELADAFSAEVTFRLDPRRLQLLNGGGADGAPLSTIQGGAVRAVRTEDRTLAAFGLSTRVVDAQAVAAVALGASLVGLAMLGALALVIRRRGEAAMIRARYGDLLLPARLTQLSGAAALVEISDIKHLVEIARREGLMVLHEEDGDGDCFMVVGRDAVHYYRTRAEPAAPAEARAEAPPNLVLMPGPGTDSAPAAQPDGRDLRRAG